MSGTKTMVYLSGKGHGIYNKVSALILAHKTSVERAINFFLCLILEHIHKLKLSIYSESVQKGKNILD